ncbi:hypothetical protein OGAPHI_006829 [Ogataea philodendri]|uniref:Uncharacterized protein n=1 Tax=Ogataea philodendri TaxID=1378263 RepID=A0A9P8NYA1_9ASCO|nr:uncharacterized protein OGAPHI_006829 [Ogataea philodendri]KAH3661422.1 hypothetical protein OGAPHI_006829 [Ogataea philodendri]
MLSEVLWKIVIFGPFLGAKVGVETFDEVLHLVKTRDQHAGGRRDVAFVFELPELHHESLVHDSGNVVVGASLGERLQVGVCAAQEMVSGVDRRQRRGVVLDEPFWVVRQRVDDQQTVEQSFADFRLVVYGRVAGFLDAIQTQRLGSLDGDP